MKPERITKEEFAEIIEEMSVNELKEFINVLTERLLERMEDEDEE